MKHVHNKEIIAWANGNEIQLLHTFDQDWNDDLNPTWNPANKYRVKPKEPRTVFLNIYSETNIWSSYESKNNAKRMAMPYATEVAVEFREVIKE